MADGAGSGLELRGKDRLDGINDHHSRFEFLDGLDDLLQRVLCQHVEVLGGDPDTIRAHLGLAQRFFPGYVKDAHSSAGQSVQGLEEKGGFADSRVTADEHHRANH